MERIVVQEESLHKQLPDVEVREFEQASSVQRLQRKDVMQGESPEPELKDIIPLTKILRPSPALM